MEAIGVDRKWIRETISDCLIKEFRRIDGKDARMKAWIGQDWKQVRKVGRAKAAWYAYWKDPEGKQRCKSCGFGIDGKRLARKEANRINAELVTGTYGSNSSKTWDEFRAEYEAKIFGGMSPHTQHIKRQAFGVFERIISPGRMSVIRTARIDEFISKRRAEMSQRRLGPGREKILVSPATINKELRQIKAAFRKAKKWGYCKDIPDFDMEREPEKIPQYVAPDDFAKLYGACGKAKLPEGTDAPAWWRALLIFGYMTGWRIGELLAVERDAIDFKTGEAFLGADATKGRRDVKIVLHNVVIKHLRKLPRLSLHVFPWPHNRRTLDVQFRRIQKAAGVRQYGFHDLRRAFATLNADRISADALQILMRHRSYETTKRYINMARQLRPATEALFVPALSKAT